MQDVLELASANLLTPMILAFALGLFAALARSELTIPEAVAKGMSIYLLFAIGFKGGVAVADNGLDARLIAALLAGVALSFVIPFVAFALLKAMTRLSATDAAAVEAAFAEGREAPVPLIIGTNSAEFWWMKPSDLSPYGAIDVVDGKLKINTRLTRRLGLLEKRH